MSQTRLTLVCTLLVIAAWPARPALAEGVHPLSQPEQAAMIKTQTVAAKQYNTCAIKTDGTLACWGENRFGEGSPPPGTFTQIAMGSYHGCGLRTDGTVACWGETANNQNGGFPSGVTFVQIGAGEVHTCGIKTDGTLYCWGGWGGFGELSVPTGTFTQIGVGSDHACAVKTDGTLACWGAGTTNSGNDPEYGQSMPPGGTFVQVSAGWRYSCGLRTDGTLACWGNPFNDVVGGVPSSGTFVQIAAADYSVCAIAADSTVVCWGNTNFGNGSNQTPPAGMTFTQVAGGVSHTCGLRTDGELLCWGDGQLTVPPGSFGRSQVSSGLQHSCWLKTDGTIACWGDNSYGQATPPAGTYTQVSAGDNHNCAIKTDGTLACWGADSDGQVTGVPAGTFVQVSAAAAHTCAVTTGGGMSCWGNDSENQVSHTPVGATFTQVSVSGFHTCGLRTDGFLACWGANAQGQAAPPTTKFTQVSAGPQYTCGLHTDGSVECWGDDADGVVSNVPAGTFTHVDAGGSHACAQQIDGALLCWGLDANGQASPPGATFTQSSSGGSHSCGLLVDGSLTCWGENSSGQSQPFTISGNAGVGGAILSYVEGGATRTVVSDVTGNYSFRTPYGWSGTVSPTKSNTTFTPVSVDYSNLVADQVNQDYTVSQISAGNDFACRLTNDGTVSCWGRNDPGVFQSTPPAGPFTQVSAGFLQACGLRPDGTLECWGSNQEGAATPPAATLFTQVSASYFYTCGVRSDGSLACWGYDGAGTVSGVPTTGTFTGVSAASNHACALQTDGMPVCWGSDVDGQSSPTSPGPYTQITAGLHHSCGLASDGTLACWGYNGQGQASPPPGTFRQVSAGDYHTCAVGIDGTVTCWGHAGAGATNAPLGTFAQVSAGASFTCALTTDGAPLCWGDNTLRQLLPIRISGNTAAAGATLSYTDGTPQTVTADGSGDYLITLPYDWSGTVTPSKAGGVVFTPASIDYTNLTAHQTAQDYTATVKISGNAGTDGVTLSYTAGTPQTVVADASGHYVLTVPYNWSGTVTPSKASGVSFSPASLTYANVIEDLAGQDYTASITLSGNARAAGATLSYTDGTARVVTADVSGVYSFEVSYGWSGTVTPSKAGGVTFTPASRSYTSLIADLSGEDYTATVTLSGNAGAAGATLSYTDGTAQTVTADGSGAYAFEVPYGWSGTVTPSKAGGLTFTPASRTYTNQLDDVAGQDYMAMVTVSGNAGAGGATLDFGDGRMTTADGTGAYTYEVPYGWSGTVTPSKAGGLTFTPASRSYVGQVADTAGQDYSATVTVSGNAGIAGAMLTYFDAIPKTATADGGGAYSFEVPYDWSGTVTPSLAGYGFIPTSRTYVSVQVDQTGQGYMATVIISGNAGAGSATLSYNDGTPRTATSDYNGNYAFAVPYLWSGTVTPSKAGGVFFAPGSRSYTNQAVDAPGQDYAARVLPAVWSSFFAVNTLETPMVGDFNGDGKADIITFTRQNPLAFGDVYVALSNGATFGAADKWHDFFSIDSSETVVIGDFDGDGKDDIATWLGTTTKQVYVALSFGTGMAVESVWENSIGFDPTDVLAAGDVNGDGKKDLVLFARKRGQVYAALSNGTGFGIPILWHAFFAVSTYERPRLADVNGDGKADIVTFATDSPTAFGDVYTALSDGTKFGDGLNSVKWHDFFAIRQSEQVQIGDLNGDGKDDFFTFLPPPFGQCYTVLSEGTRMGPSVLWPEVVAPRATDRPFTGDVNGDGKADILYFAQGEGKVYVALTP